MYADKTLLSKLTSPLKNRGFLIITLTSIFLASFVIYAVAAEQTDDAPVETVANDNPDISFVVEDNLLYRIDASGQKTEVRKYEAKLDPTGKYVAYTNKLTDAWGVEPYIFIFNLTTKETEKIPTVEDDIARFVYSWSLDSKHALLTDFAQAVGELKGRVYSIADKSLEAEFQMYDHNSTWSSDGKLYFLSSTKACTAENTSHCKLDKISVNEYTLSKKTTTEIGTLPRDELPIISNVSLDNQNSLKINYSTYDYPQETKKTLDVTITNANN